MSSNPRTLNAREALARKNPYANWSNAVDRLMPETWPKIEPNFKLSPGSSVFTIGSCFARNIEEHLSIIGCDVPTLEFGVPKVEWSGLRDNGILNKYTAASIYQDIAWTEEIYARGDDFQDLDSDKFLFEVADNTVIDLQLGGFAPVTRERFYQRRRDLYQLNKKIFDVECVTITLGLIEAWRIGDLYVQQPPANRQMLKHASEFDFEILDYPTCLSMIEKSIALIRKHNSKVKFLITTSPVPMERTFSEDDVIIANMTSKSTLRTVAHEIARKSHNVDYFPSYESVTLSQRDSAFEKDQIHIRDGFVGKIVEGLIDTYFETESEMFKLLQQSRTELDAGDKADFDVFKAAREAMPKHEKLTQIQAVTFLRVLWRLRDRKTARRVGLNLMKRNTRNHATLRAIAHIFPRIGLENEARIYANELLKNDPENQLALSLAG